MFMYLLEGLGVWEAFINCSPVQEILAPCAVLCCLWFSGDVSLDACVGIRVRYGE
jgi:hypothetical protein